MLLLLVCSALAGPRPLPPHVPSARLEGFVQIWVDPEAFADALAPAEAEPVERTPERHVHPLTPGPLVVLIPREGTSLDAVQQAVEGVEGARVIRRDDAAGGLTVEHPDPLDLLALPLGEGSLGDAVDLLQVPIVPIGRMPLPPGAVARAALADLPVENVASARAVLLVGGVEVGEIGPYATAVIHGVPPGTYELQFRLPNGYVRKATSHTGQGLSPQATYRSR